MSAGSGAAGGGGGGAGGMAVLSGRRELVEQLESSDPLLDYLVQNGALEPPTVEQIKSEKSAAKVRRVCVCVRA